MHCGGMLSNHDGDGAGHLHRPWTCQLGSGGSDSRPGYTFHVTRETDTLSDDAKGPLGPQSRTQLQNVLCGVD